MAQYIVVKHDVFPFFLVYELESKRRNEYKAKGISGYYEVSSVIATISESEAKRLMRRIDGLKYIRRQLNVLTNRDAQIALDSAVTGGE